MANQTKLLEGIQAPGVQLSVRDLAKYMASNGVVVKPYVGRARGYIPMPGKAYGIDLEKFSEAGGTFFKERVSASHINFIPPEDEAELCALEKRLRRAVEGRTLADGFMPQAAYDSLKAEYEKIRTQYFAKRDDILGKWDSLVSSFQDGAKEMLDGIAIPETMKEQLLKEFLSNVPTADYYKSRFEMGLRVQAFPANVDSTGLNSSIAADVRNTWKDEVVSTAILSIENQVGEAWEKLLGGMRQYLKGNTIKQSTINSLAKLANDLSWKNVFNNALLRDLSTSLNKIQLMDTEAQAAAIEDAVVYTYGYAKDTRMDLKFDGSPYSLQQLEAMLKSYTSTKKGA